MKPPMILLLSFSAIALGACTTARKVEPLAPPIDPSDPKIARGQKGFLPAVPPMSSPWAGRVGTGNRQ